jgi:DNA-binding NtrC family response regulator
MPVNKSSKLAQPGPGPRSHGRLQRALDAAATKVIRAALRETSGNVRDAASLLGINRISLVKRLKTLAIDPNRYR